MRIITGLDIYQYFWEFTRNFNYEVEDKSGTFAWHHMIMWMKWEDRDIYKLHTYRVYTEGWEWWLRIEGWVTGQRRCCNNEGQRCVVWICKWKWEYWSKWCETYWGNSNASSPNPCMKYVNSAELLQYLHKPHFTRLPRNTSSPVCQSHSTSSLLEYTHHSVSALFHPLTSRVTLIISTFLNDIYLNK